MDRPRAPGTAARILDIAARLVQSRGCNASRQLLATVRPDCLKARRAGA